MKNSMSSKSQPKKLQFKTASSYVRLYSQVPTYTTTPASQPE